VSEFLIVLLCLFFNSLLAAYEMAFVAIPKAELRAIAKSGNRKAQSLLHLRDNPERTLSIIQIGITLVGAIAAAVGGAGASDNIEPYIIATFGLSASTSEAIAVAIVVLPLSYLSVVIGELVPKSLALRNPKSILFAGLGALTVADKILAPFIYILEATTNLLLSTFFPEQKKPDAIAHTTLEIDSLSPTHQRFVINMANIETKQVRDIMLSWSQVSHISKSNTTDEITHIVMSSGHTRLPVCDESQVVGILHTKEFLAMRETHITNWHEIIRPVLPSRVTDSAFGLLRRLQDQHSHLSVVFSDAGERVGIVTLEDIVEEIIGEIFDEDDDNKIRKIFISRSREKTQRS